MISFSNKTIEALKMAIEGLLELHSFVNEELETSYRINTNQAVKLKTKLDGVEKTIQACKEALAEAEKQEIGEAEIRQMLKEIEWCHQELEKKEWQSLSDDEMDDLFKKHGVMFLEGNFKFARAIEAKLKEKNHE